MARNILYTLVFISLVSFAAEAQQNPTSVASPTATPITKKVNARPQATPTPLASEPFEKADAATMAGNCVKLVTEVGDIDIELYPDKAPESVRNFLNLVASGAFDTTTFSRVVPGFVIQGGDIWTREGGMTAELGKRAARIVPDEPNSIHHKRGIVSMARREESNTATSHFFILVADAPLLDNKYAAFGRVTKGMDIVDAINKAPVVNEKPLRPVRIKKASVFACTTSR